MLTMLLLEGRSILAPPHKQQITSPEIPLRCVYDQFFFFQPHLLTSQKFHLSLIA